jgi:hypothetical protein
MRLILPLRQFSLPPKKLRVVFGPRVVFWVGTVRVIDKKSK